MNSDHIESVKTNNPTTDSQLQPEEASSAQQNTDTGAQTPSTVTAANARQGNTANNKGRSRDLSTAKTA